MNDKTFLTIVIMNTWYKITRVFRNRPAACVNRTGSIRSELPIGTLSSQDGPVDVGEILALYAKGLVYAPTEDMREDRVRAWLFGSPDDSEITWPCVAGQCPERNVCGQAGHCVEEPRSSERPSDEIVLCGGCPHPRHWGNGGRCTGSVPSGEPSGGIESCRCVDAEIQEYGS